MKFRTLLSVLVVLVGCATEQEPVDTLTKREAPQEKTQPVQPAQGDQEQPAEQVNIIQAYIEAGSVRSRARYVLNPEAALPRMEKRYEGSNLRDIEAIEIKRIDGQGNPKVGKYGKYKASWESRGRFATGIYYVKNTRDGLKIDWEASTGFNEMSWSGFLALRPTTPMIFRVNAQISDYYNYEFSGAHNTHYSIRLPEVYSVYGYARKNSPLGRQLFDILKDGERHNLTLQVRFFRNPAPHTNTVIIDKLISEDWLIR